MRARALDGREIELDDARVTALKARHRGAIVLPGEPGYDESRTLWNAMIDRRPCVVARCLGVADVMAVRALRARERAAALRSRAAGTTSPASRWPTAALLIDLSPMRGVWVDAPKRIARAQGGCLLGDVDRETQLHGLAAVLGFVSMTGIAGLTLGGGFGYLTRRWGWTSDNVVGDGGRDRRRAARARQRRRECGPLLGAAWRRRQFRRRDGHRVLAVPRSARRSSAGWWPGRRARRRRVLELYRKLAESSPPELTLVALMRHAPPAPWLPKERHGTPIVAILACHSGDPDEGERAVAPIKSFGTPIGDVLVRRPYAQLQTLLDATQPKGRRYYWKSEYLPRIEPELCAGAIEQAARIRSPHSAVILFQIGGALNRLAADHSPVGNRDARYVLNIAGSWERAEDDAANVEWAREAWRDLRRFSTGGTYVNFLNREELSERLDSALGDAVRRLSEVKSAWDPTNQFRANHNIPPPASVGA